MARHVNIPVFIPHEGCRNECVFCNQRTITGVHNRDDSKVKELIDKALSTIEDDAEVEIAFFGGSFTGIGIDRMTYLCSVAYEYVKSGRVGSIRLSTRPDYIDEEILSILKKYGVTHIELGIQSMRQHVLDACKRGHTVCDTERACRLINEYGFILGGQMMVGLPSSTAEDEMYTAERIIEMGAKEARIYPCVVFCNTELCNMAKSGEYTPITVDEAVERSAKVYRRLQTCGINVLRVGLQSSEALSEGSEVYGGAYHPAMGELVMSRVMLDRLLSAIDFIKSHKDSEYQGKPFIVECNRCDLSKIIGHKKSNTEIIRKAALDAGFSDYIIKTNEQEKPGCFLVHFDR